MTDIKLFIAPGSCARVPTILLEEIGLPYTTELVRFMKGEHKSPAYKAYNPKGKVPAILIDGEALTENVAIISLLNERFPDAGLLPDQRATRWQRRGNSPTCASARRPSTPSLPASGCRNFLPHLKRRAPSGIWGARPCTNIFS